MPPQHHNDKKSRDSVLRIEKDIRTLRAQNKTNQEVMDTLRIPLRTYRRYCSNINKQDRDLWNDIHREQIYTEMLRLKDSLEETYRIALSMANDPNCKTRLEALEVKDEARTRIVQLLLNGPSYIEEEALTPFAPIEPENTQDNNNYTTSTVTVAPNRPTGYPTIFDERNNRWVTDPEWIRQNSKRVMATNYTLDETTGEYRRK